MRPLLCLIALVPVLASAQVELVGKNRYPQFRTFSALPGGGFGLTPEGKPDFRGAMGISTPIAYSLAHLRFNIGVSNTGSDAGDFSFSDNNRNANGTAWGMGGLKTPLGNLTASYMVLSRIGDSAFNFHFQPRIVSEETEKYSAEIRRFDFGFGVQDAFNTGGASGQAIDNATGGGNSTSFYAVGTMRVTEDFYASLGVGTQRFKGVFGNASYNLTPNVKATLEYDTFNWNYGLSFKAAEFGNGDRSGNISVFLGHIRGKYLTWGLNVSF